MNEWELGMKKRERRRRELFEMLETLLKSAEIFNILKYKIIFSKEIKC